MKDRLTAAQIWEALEGVPLMEAGTAEVIVPRRGSVIREDGSVKVAVIRPCVSKGRKIRGLPPIYTPSALAESAAVFSGWPMYQDHLAEEAVEQMASALEGAGQQELLELLKERARSIRELGGRIVKSWWDPELELPGDEEKGYQKGGVVAEAIPQPRIKKMLEADPEILSVVNAWPTGARPGVAAPWNQTLRGMVIEGISPKPPGSVDWIFAPGAGGRPLLAEDATLQERAVSLLESAYSAGAPVKTLSEKLKEAKTQEELRSILQEEAPHLVETLVTEEDGGSNGGGNGGVITEDRLSEMLKEQREELEESFKEQLEEAKDEEKERLQEREEQRGLEKVADDYLAEAVRNGFPQSAADGLKVRYSLLPSGPGAGLLVEAEKEGEEVKKPVEEVLKERIKEDVKHVVEVIRESGGNVQVRGIAPGPDPEGSSSGGGGAASGAFRTFLRESGDEVEKDEKGGKKKDDDEDGEE